MRVVPDVSGFDQLAGLFDEYRVHFGETPDAGRAASWLREHLGSGRLRAAVAIVDGRAAGLVTSTVLPASLRLATFWMIRDLFVAPAERRGGVARALLNHVVTEAVAAGAIRVSLQTEPQNRPALSLYASAGFRPVDGLTTLSLPTPDPANQDPAGSEPSDPNPDPASQDPADSEPSDPNPVNQDPINQDPVS